MKAQIKLSPDIDNESDKIYKQHQQKKYIYTHICIVWLIETNLWYLSNWNVFRAIWNEDKFMFDENITTIWEKNQTVDRRNEMKKKLKSNSENPRFGVCSCDRCVCCWALVLLWRVVFIV